MTSRILIVHDQSHRREQLRECLEPPHEVDVCASVQEAIARLKSKEAAHLSGSPVDLILSAVHLDSPDNLSVFDLLKWTRGNSLTSDVPFVLLDLQPSSTAKYVVDATRAAGSALGATAYIVTDSFHPDKFRAAVESYLKLESRATEEGEPTFPSDSALRRTGGELV